MQSLTDSFQRDVDGGGCFICTHDLSFNCDEAKDQQQEPVNHIYFIFSRKASKCHQHPCSAGKT